LWSPINTHIFCGVLRIPCIYLYTNYYQIRKIDFSGFFKETNTRYLIYSATSIDFNKCLWLQYSFCTLHKYLLTAWYQNILYKNSFILNGGRHGRDHIYGSWIYNYIWNQCLSPLTLWVQIPLMGRCTRYKFMW